MYMFTIDLQMCDTSLSLSCRNITKTCGFICPVSRQEGHVLYETLEKVLLSLNDIAPYNMSR